MINISSLQFSYPGTDFQLSISGLHMNAGEKLAVIGPSGTGKTTLLNLIAGILTPQRGSISVGDVEVNTLSDDKRREFRITTIGFVFQDFELIEYLNVFDNILHPYRITGALRLDVNVRQRAINLAESMDIQDKLKRFANDLSHGEKQRVAICRALLPEPKLILADEATGNLDPENKVHILDLLFESAVEHDAPLLAVTHDHELLPRFGRVVDFRAFGHTSAA